MEMLSQPYFPYYRHNHSSLTTGTMNELLANQQRYFHEGHTRSFQKRKDALVQLRKQIKRYEAQICQALREDLGKSEPEAYITEIGLTIAEINYALKHLRRWMRPKRCNTPLTNFPAQQKILYEPYGAVLTLPVSLSWRTRSRELLYPKTLGASSRYCHTSGTTG